MDDPTGMTIAVEEFRSGLAGEPASGSPVQPSRDSVHMSDQAEHRDDTSASVKSGKPISFYFASLSLRMGVLLMSLDVTALPVAIPICLWG